MHFWRRNRLWDRLVLSPSFWHPSIYQICALFWAGFSTTRRYGWSRHSCWVRFCIKIMWLQPHLFCFFFFLLRGGKAFQLQRTKDGTPLTKGIVPPPWGKRRLAAREKDLQAQNLEGTITNQHNLPFVCVGSEHKQQSKSESQGGGHILIYKNQLTFFLT